MLAKIKNYFLCLKYPFLRQRNAFTDKPCDYSYTWYDEIPKGWQKAFGKKLLRDLKNAIKKDNCLKTFRFNQIKEKYGTLRLYANGFGKNTDRVLSYYEAISIGYCIECGKPARYLTQGWLTYLCEDCSIDYLLEVKHIDNLEDLYVELEELRLKTKDIPIFDCADEDLQKMYDSIGYKKLWEIEEDGK